MLLSFESEWCLVDGRMGLGVAGVVFVVDSWGLGASRIPQVNLLYSALDGRGVSVVRVAAIKVVHGEHRKEVRLGECHAVM